jgi:hypothetical protein
MKVVLRDFFGIQYKVTVVDIALIRTQKALEQGNT